MRTALMLMMNADLSQLEVHHSLQRIIFEEVLKNITWI